MINTKDKIDKPIKRPNENEYMVSMSDTIFKAIIQHPKFRRLLSLIISDMINLSPSFVAENLIFINTELPVENKKEKKKITDILAKVDGSTINIEANRFLKSSTSAKNNLYHHKLAYSHYFSGENLDNSEVIQINFNMIKKYGNKLFTSFTLKSDDGKYTDEENFKRIHINMANPLEKYYNYGIKQLSKIEKAIVMFQITNKKELKDLAKGDEDLMAMAKIIDDLNNDVTLIDLYSKEELDEWQKRVDRNQAIKEGRAEGRAEGIIEGKAKGKTEGKAEGKIESTLEIAQNMLNMNMDIEIISKATGLSESQINNLKAKKDKD